MPIYEYKCNNCGKVVEVMQKFSDKPLSRCPSCGGRLTRLISNCSFQLKGTGWYVTDYKKGDSGRAPKKTEEKTETKTETKTDSATSTSAKTESTPS
ncbi:MAG TPA: FmdB family zinc ribbon protein [Thermodesulfobacteriota bacterium]|nr:FmdB family zinc ribbon protein [Thermodesulfobacteriota bacterium]